MPLDVYRKSADPNVAEPPEPSPLWVGEEFVIAFLVLTVAVLLLVVGLSGGREHATEGGLGGLALILAIRCLFDAYRATRREPKR